MTATRWSFAVSGLVLLVVGVGGMVTEVAQLPQLVLWLMGALVAHDGIAAPAALLLGAGLWRVSARAPRPVRQIVVGGFAVAAMLTLLAWPVLVQRGQVANDTVVFQDYGRNLGWLLAATAVLTAAAATVAWFVHRRARSTSEDG